MCVCVCVWGKRNPRITLQNKGGLNIVRAKNLHERYSRRHACKYVFERPINIVEISYKHLNGKIDAAPQSVHSLNHYTPK